MICLPLHMSMQYVRMYVCLSMGPDGVAEGRKGGVAEGAQAGQDQCHRSLQDGKGIPSQSCVQVQYVCTSMQTQLASTLSYRCALDKEITRKLSSTSSWLLQRNPMKR